MKFTKFSSNKSRKGISSIVGGIFFLVLMTTGFTVYYVALDSQSQMLDTQQIIADSEVAKIQEKFVVAASSDSSDNDRLSVQIVNTGNNPVEIADIWIINKTDATQPAERHDLDYRDVSVPVGYSGDILENTPLYLIPDIYDIKVISTLGTIRTVEFDVNGGSNVLKAQMVAIPQDVRFGENATVTLIVTNTGEFPIDNVQANSLDVSPNQCRDPPNPIFIGPTDLSPSQSTMFFWDCILDPPLGNIITFTSNATGQISGVDVDSNDASDSVIVRDFTSGLGDELILKDELFGRPEIFMIVPNVFGAVPNSDNGQGFWGVIIANPTNKTMTVSKVSISALRGNANDNAVVIPNNCDKTMISPTTGWTCPNDNIITWKNSVTPISIPRQSAYPFIIKTEPGDSNNGLETIVVSSSVFSSLGAFGKGPYETSLQTKVSAEAIVNVFMSDAVGNIRGVVSGVPSGSTHQFNVRMADFSENPAAINQISELIINVPKEWSYVSSSVTSSGFDSIIPTTFADGSTQIVAGLSANLDNSQAWVRFSAIAPSITSTNAKMYVFHILGSGVTTGASTYLIGPLAETIVQVCPPSGGPPGCP